MPNDTLITALFGAFATFTAFGAAIAGFLAAGGALQALAAWWLQHGADEDSEDNKATIWFVSRQKLRWLLATAAIVLVTLLILVVIVISGVGLVLCFIWLDAYSHNASGGINDTYRWIIRLFWIEAALLTVATFLAVVAAAISSITASRSARVQAKSSAHLDTALRNAAIGWLDDDARVGSTKQGR
jgi:hypothetical protein